MVELLVLLIVGGVPGTEERAPSVVEVTGDASCPTAAQITQSLARLHPDLDAHGWGVELSTGTSAADLRMRVHDPSNVLVGERRFNGLTDCDQRADAVAATLAVWLGELAAQLLPAPIYPAANKEEPPAPEAASPSALVVSRATAPNARPPAWQLELGAAALGSIDETGAGAAGIDLSTWVRPVGRLWGLQAQLEWESPRSLTLGPGFADWQRVTLGAGAHLPLERGWGGFELAARVLAGLTVTQGRDLTVPHLDAALEPGFSVGARFFVDPRPSWRGWLSVGLALWPVRQQVGLFSPTAATPSSLATLPQLELLLALGGSWLDL